MKIKISNIDFKNPIIPASGTFGFGYEFKQFYDLKKLGSIALKATTLEKRYGNQLPRIAEVDSGLLNSIGLQNPGIKDVIENELPKLKELIDFPLIANVSGNTIEEYVLVCQEFDKHEMIGILELNVSCPNVKKGGIHFGNDIDLLTELIKKVKNCCTKPLYIKLSPNVNNIVEIAIACEKAGCDGLVMINTLVGMKIDIHQKNIVLDNKIGGLSGKCIKPIAVRMIHDVYKNVNIPIIGVGGISNANDVIEMMMAGASAVQIGSENLINPYVCCEIIDELPNLIEKLGYEKITDIIGVVHD